MVYNNRKPTFVLTNHVSVETAAKLSGYSLQYLRRLLRTDKLPGVKMGQLWLIDIFALDEYLESTATNGDGRFGPKRQI